MKVDWDARCARSLADEDIVRLIFDGTVFQTWLDRKATSLSVLAAIGVRRDGQKMLLSVITWAERAPQPGGSSSKTSTPGATRIRDRRRRPGLDAVLVALWGDDLLIQRYTVHKLRNLLAHAPKHMQNELTED